MLEKLISENNEDEHSMNKCAIVYIGNVCIHKLVKIKNNLFFIQCYNRLN